MATKNSPLVSPINPAVAAAQSEAASAASKKKRKKVPNKKSASAFALAEKKSQLELATKSKKDGKPKKIKMVRDSYTMPENDYARLAELKKTCLKAGVHVKKSELLRAGLTALAKMSTAALLKTVDGLVKIKTGRPGKP